MVAPNMYDPFIVDIVAVFPENTWQINAVNNSVNNFVTFQGTKNSIITSLFAPNALVIIKDQITTTKFLIYRFFELDLICNFTWFCNW